MAKYGLGGMLTLLLLLSLAILAGCKESEQSRAWRQAREKRHAEYVQKLKAYVPAETLKNVPEEFYEYPGIRDYWRFPLTYPYSIGVIDTFDNPGFLQHARNATADKEWHQITGEERVLDGLTHLAFDSRTLVARVEMEHPATGPATVSKVKWLVFDFASGTQAYFTSGKAALDEAARRGFPKDAVLEPLKTHFERSF